MFPGFHCFIGIVSILAAQTFGAEISVYLVLMVLMVHFCMKVKITNMFWLELLFSLPLSLSTIYYVDNCGTETGTLFIAAFAAFWNLSFVSVLKEERIIKYFKWN